MGLHLDWVNNEVHTLVVMKTTSDDCNPCKTEDFVRFWMHDAGYVPYTKFMLYDVEEEENSC